ncbi:hypothetical protein Q5752_006466 [Cryptotrichosporon argae]
MSGYLPPHYGPDSDAPYAEVYTPQYAVHAPAASDPQPSQHHLHLAVDAVPQPETRITAGPDADAPLIKLPPLGFGLWGWGDVLTYGWGPSGGYDKKNNEENSGRAFDAIVEHFPLVLLDNAEHYGYTDGFCEKLQGRLTAEAIADGRFARDRLVFATKYFPTPWRHPWKYPQQVLDSASGSIARARVHHIDIYQLHGPSHFGFWPRLATLVDSLARTYHQGKSKHIGTCNLSLDQVRYVYAELKKRGVPMVSNQVEFSLVRMDPWKYGLIHGCAELGLVTIAYSPLALGRLTGKYSAEHPPRGNRNFGHISWSKIQPIVDVLTLIGEQVGKRPAAVALNWVICKGAIPIPTCKSKQQVEDARAALGWRLTPDQERALDSVGRVDEFDWNLLKHFQNWWWQQG